MAAREAYSLYVERAVEGADGEQIGPFHRSSLVLCFIITVTYSPVRRRDSSPWL